MRRDAIIIDAMVQYMKSMTELCDVLKESVDLHKKRLKQEEQLNTLKDENIQELNEKITILNRIISAQEETISLLKKDNKEKKKNESWFHSWLKFK